MMPENLPSAMNDDEILQTLLLSVPECDSDIIMPDDGEEDESVGIDTASELIACFTQEVSGNMMEIHYAINTLKNQIKMPSIISPSLRKILDSLRQSVSTIKGASAVVGLDHLAALTGSMEELLDWYYDVSLEITPEFIVMLSNTERMLQTSIDCPDQISLEDISALSAQHRSFIGTDVNKIRLDPEKFGVSFDI